MRELILFASDRRVVDGSLSSDDEGNVGDGGIDHKNFRKFAVYSNRLIIGFTGIIDHWRVIRDEMLSKGLTNYHDVESFLRTRENIWTVGSGSRDAMRVLLANRTPTLGSTLAVNAVVEAVCEAARMDRNTGGYCKVGVIGDATRLVLHAPFKIKNHLMDRNFRVLLYPDDSAFEDERTHIFEDNFIVAFTENPWLQLTKSTFVEVYRESLDAMSKTAPLDEGTGGNVHCLILDGSELKNEEQEARSINIPRYLRELNLGTQALRGVEEEDGLPKVISMFSPSSSEPEPWSFSESDDESVVEDVCFLFNT
ncbi:OLC1v1005633C1 [Oldenlandia corymbosa var. corymbosa]|uniref:OLC1v1005633C1 n=1 Tax=Oldenlandia corymbosa var. corymbosa TaxID=529605 RepID=A0AAV1DI03_OLDCO|nr:OLC1v1005633C1 [Oldenlandia corymbosa var. corymbosa]